MGVEIETISPGDGKITLMQLLSCKVVNYLLSCVRLTALYCCSVSPRAAFTGRTFPKKGQTCVVHYVGELNFRCSFGGCTDVVFL